MTTISALAVSKKQIQQIVSATRNTAMFNWTFTRLLALAILAVALTAPVHAWNINKGINIEDGATSGGQSSVNGSITVGTKATVTGELETVNGAIRVDDDATVEDLQTVNGSIRVGANVKTADISGVNGSIRLGSNVVVDGEISVVNGRISTEAGTRISKDVSNVNGEFQISGSTIGGDLTTVNGDVWLMDQSELQGDLIVEMPSGWNSQGQRDPSIVIGAGSTVKGVIRLERKVKLYIHETASVAAVSGEMTLADAVRFSGDRP
jgi:cytoskeletal protein CcmA (bactofilin family)